MGLSLYFPEQEPQPDPTQWGERLGLISSGTPNQPPIVLHCFEDLRPSDEDEGEYIRGKKTIEQIHTLYSVNTELPILKLQGGVGSTGTLLALLEMVLIQSLMK